MPEKKKYEVLPVRIEEPIAAKLREIAKTLGFTYSKGGSIAKLLKAIASGEIILIKSVDKKS